MSYCTISDINALVPQSPFTSQTVPTQAQVEAFASSVSTRMDATLRNLGYTTPVVTGTASLILLKEACAWGTLGLASQARLTAVAPDMAVGLSVWTKMFDKWMKDLGDNECPFELPDAPRTGKEVLKPIGELQADPMSDSVDSGSTSTDPYNYISSPPFSIGMKF